MLVLKRKEGQWIEIKHRSGDTIRVRVYNIRPHLPGQLDLVFEDEALNFEVQRPERTAAERAERPRVRLGPEPSRGLDWPRVAGGPEAFPLRPLSHCLSRRATAARRSDRPN